jgi:hypothetical protein
LTHATIHRFVARLRRRRRHLTDRGVLIGRCAAAVAGLWHPYVGLAVFLAVLSVSMVVIVRVLDGEPWVLTAFRFGCLLVLLLAAGWPYRSLRCASTPAAPGEEFEIRRGDDPPPEVLSSAAASVSCFPAGPSVFAGLGWLYWLSCGEPAWLDWLILAELAIVAGACWIYALLAVGYRGRLDDVNPLAVADMVHRLGWRGLAVVLLAALVLLAHGGLVWVVAAAEVQGAALEGGAVLAAAWFSAACCGAVFCRWLGDRRHRSRPVLAEQERAPAVSIPVAPVLSARSPEANIRAIVDQMESRPASHAADGAENVGITQLRRPSDQPR